MSYTTKVYRDQGGDVRGSTLNHRGRWGAFCEAKDGNESCSSHTHPLSDRLLCRRSLCRLGLNPTAGNLLHHSVEMCLKGALAKKGKSTDDLIGLHRTKAAGAGNAARV